MYCISGESGQILWKFTPSEDKRILKQRTMRGSPTISDDRIVYCDHAGRLYCLEFETGELLWKSSGLAANATPLVVNKRIFCKYLQRQEPDQKLETGYMSFSLDGGLLWKFYARSRVFTEHAACDGDLIVFGDQKGFVYAVSVENGELLWEFDVNDVIDLVDPITDEPKTSSVSGCPCIIDNQAIFRSGYHLLAFNLSSGELNWLYSSPAKSIRGIAPGDGFLMYIDSVCRYLSRIDIQNGSQVWTIEKPPGDLGDTLAETATVIGDYYYCGFNSSASVAGFFTETGELAWTFQSPKKYGFTHATVFADDLLFLGDNQGNFYCFSASEVGDQSVNKVILEMTRNHLDTVSSLRWEETAQDDLIMAEYPSPGNGPDNSEYVDVLVSILKGLGINVADDPERIATASTHRVQALILGSLLPDRILIFDAEMISTGRDYGVLLNSLAQLTGGEWNPSNVRAAVDLDGYHAYMKFEYQGETHSWDFEHHFDWVSPEFHELCRVFAEEHLPGRFISLRTDSQESAFLYLPLEAAEEMERFLDQSA
jgi:outer membrane protein assembly factor BamB